MDNHMTATEVLCARKQESPAEGRIERVFGKIIEETFRLHQMTASNVALNRYSGPVE